MNDSTLSVGADVHLKDIVLRAVDQGDGHEVIEPLTVTNNLSGARSAAATIAQTATRLGYRRIQIGYEATGMLWIPFHRFLSTSPLLEPFDLELVCFNPKLVADFKDALVLRRPKNDERDTFDVAARVRFGEWPDSYVPGPFWQGRSPAPHPLPLQALPEPLPREDALPILCFPQMERLEAR